MASLAAHAIFVYRFALDYSGSPASALHGDCQRGGGNASTDNANIYLRYSKPRCVGHFASSFRQ
jgi:hypothetical protein